MVTVGSNVMSHPHGEASSYLSFFPRIQNGSDDDGQLRAPAVGDGPTEILPPDLAKLDGSPPYAADQWKSEAMMGKISRGLGRSRTRWGKATTSSGLETAASGPWISP